MARSDERRWAAGPLVILTALAYWLTAWFSLRFAPLPELGSLLWLPAGVALGATYWLGYRVGLAGSGLGAAIVAWFAWRNGLLALLSALPVMLQAALGVTLLRLTALEPRMHRPRDAVRFIAIAAGAALVSPLLNSLIQGIFGIVPSDQLVQAIPYRWMGEWMGHLILGGLLLVWWGNGRMRKRDYAMLTLLGGLGVVSVWLMFYLSQIRALLAPPTVILLPVLVTATVWYQQRGVTA
ncbi:MAG: MASE1 domain-containing protein, partial [Fimbriimonadales bacterium]|nr:MASE1 domain-containing protein [Fimbriimonadales bacterium]